MTIARKHISGHLNPFDGFKGILVFHNIEKPDIVFMILN